MGLENTALGMIWPLVYRGMERWQCNTAALGHYVDLAAISRKFHGFIIAQIGSIHYPKRGVNCRYACALCRT